MQKWIIFALAVCAMTLPSLSADTNQVLAPGSYQIRNCKFGKLLRPEDANNADGTHIVLYSAQPWKCMTWKLIPAGESSFNLKNHFTNKTFEAKTNGTSSAVQIPWAKETSNRPSWRFTKLPNGFYRITDQRSGDSLTASSEDVIILAPWKETPEQQWEFVLTDPAKLTM
jgi:Ricin-type beta-trefoil lectin domain-like